MSLRELGISVDSYKIMSTRRNSGEWRGDVQWEMKQFYGADRTKKIIGE